MDHSVSGPACVSVSEPVRGAGDGARERVGFGDPFAESAQVSDAHIPAEPRAELRVPGLARGSLQQPELLAQRHQNFGPLQQREGEIDVVKHARDRAALPVQDLGDRAERACAGEA
jgi:hypothetical protein